MSASAAVIVFAGVPGAVFGLRAQRGPNVAAPPPVTHSTSSSAAASPPPSRTPTTPQHATLPPAGAHGGSTVGPTPRPGSSAGPPGGPVPRGFAPASVTFVSLGLGWAIGQAPCSNPHCTSVVRTKDYGRSWVGIPAPRTDGGNKPRDVSNIRFADPGDGWAYGPGLWSTHDGGASGWHEVGAPGGGRVLALAAAGGRVVAVVSTCGSQQGCAGFQVYGTPADTDQWRPLPGAKGDAANLSLTIRGGRAYVAGGPRGQSAVWSGPVDGSATWTRRDAPCTGEAVTAGIGSASSGDLVLVCAGRPDAGGQPKTVYLSDDAGASWRRVGEAPSGGLLTSIALTPEQMFFATNHGLLISSDHGRTWRRDLAGHSYAYVGFTSSRQGVLVPEDAGAGKLLFTRDGGHTWSPSRFP